MRTNHEIDYRIFGEEMQCVEIELDPQETVVAEAGSFMYKDQQIQMQTIFGDGSTSGGGGLMGQAAGCRKTIADRGEFVHDCLFAHGQRQSAGGFCFALSGKNYSDGFAANGGQSNLSKRCFPVRC